MEFFIISMLNGLSIAMRISDRALVMGHGCIVYDGTPAALMDVPHIRQEWLEI